ncbi:MAG TPA: ABC transporter ATP-binding protein [Fimbriimonadaceae bacterium]|nr:ABC transporter ATP-binding protein [Fimbriimonadaceae bacterium]
MLFRLDGVGFQYSDGTLALDGVSAEIGQGERIAIVGANGSGKSTLLKALNGLIEPSTGTVFFEGQALTEKALRDAQFQQSFRSRVGFVFQDADAQLFNATVGEELAFGPAQLGFDRHEVETRVRDVMEHLGIAYLADRPPFRLSGGEKRKVAIASILTMNPDVILFDEPFLALDPRTQSWFLRAMAQLQEAGKTTMVATHTLSTLAEIADRALVLGEDHRLLADLPVSALLCDADLLDRSGLAGAPV